MKALFPCVTFICLSAAFLSLCLSHSDVDSQTRHMALSSLFMEVLMMLNNATIPTAEFLRGSVRTWIEQKVHGLVVLPLLTATCQSLASVRHMAEMTEACITAYFREGTEPSPALCKAVDVSECIWSSS